MTIERGLRAAALLIAVLAFIDPTLSGAGPDRQTVVVLATPADDPGLATQVATALDTSFDVSLTDVPSPAAYVLTGADLPEGWRPPPDSVVFAVAPEVSQTDVRILRLSTPKELTVDSVARIEVDALVAGTGDRDLTVTLDVDGARVQEATRVVAGQDSRATAALLFVPSRPGVVHVRAEAAVPGRRTAVADAAITVTARVWRVLSFDSRPTYSATFVRRALEADPRFAVTTRIATSRVSAIQTRTPPFSLSEARALDEFDLVIVGAAEALGSAEAAALERYLRDRHGAVVLLPEGPGGTLLPALTGQGGWMQDRRADPVSVTHGAGTWSAGEFIWPATWPPLARPLATFADREEGAVSRHPVWQAPVGGGRLVVSSAIDGWRSRAGQSLGFSAFWRSVAAATANATPPLVAVDLPRRLLMPGQPADVDVQVFSDGVPAARLRDTGGIASPVRLWPSDAPSGDATGWTGGIRAPDVPGRYRLEVTTDTGVSGGAEFMVVDPDAFGAAPLRLASVPNGLSAAAAVAHRGAVVPQARLDTLPARIAEVVTPAVSRQSWYPMRSIWWLVPFTLCASGEWWLRRRRGER